jgi:hypothetical protein
MQKVWRDGATTTAAGKKAYSSTFVPSYERRYKGTPARVADKGSSRRLKGPGSEPLVIGELERSRDRDTRQQTNPGVLVAAYLIRRRLYQAARVSASEKLGSLEKQMGGPMPSTTPRPWRHEEPKVVAFNTPRPVSLSGAASRHIQLTPQRAAHEANDLTG